MSLNEAAIAGRGRLNNPGSAMQPLILYGTQACHLCEQAEQLLQQWLTRMPGRFELVTIDIAENATLVEQYGVRIPVVFHPQTGRELGWPFDIDGLDALWASDLSRDSS